MVGHSEAPDEAWSAIAPLLPRSEGQAGGGREDRADREDREDREDRGTGARPPDADQSYRADAAQRRVGRRSTSGKPQKR
jgi:hypothetical protein